MDSVTSCITYADLRRIHAERLQADGKHPQKIRDHNSAINQYASAIGKSGSCPCEEDFSERFDVNLAIFAEVLTRRGITGTVIANRISFLRAIRLTFNAMLTGAVGVDSFTKSLNALLFSHDINLHQLCTDMGINYSTLRRWTSGDLPNRRNANTIKKIERRFHLPEGALSNKLGWHLLQDAHAPTLENRKKHRHLTQDTYGYKNPPDNVRREWEELIQFRTAPYLLGGMQRSATWRVKPVDRYSKGGNLRWELMVPGGGVCITAGIFWIFIERFYGYLLREPAKGGRGMREEQLTLALLSDASLVLGFFEFKKSRSGKYTGETKRDLSFAASLLRKQTGFLWQLPKYGARLPVPMSEAEWRPWCEKNRDILIGVYRDLVIGQHFRKGRDPQEPIAKILAEQHPIRILIKMVDAMKAKFIIDQRVLLRATHKRDVLLVKMLISNPLRVHHYAIMTYRKDNTGNLYQDSLDSWRLRFQPEDFKNQRGAASKGYDVKLTPWLYEDITEYFEKFRQLLHNAESSDRVFLPAHTNTHRSFLTGDQISKRLLKLSRTYIPDCPGFQAHAFRHIVATDYIKNNPNGYQIAASILHDKLATVMREYAHIKVSDGFSHWTSYLDEQVAVMGGGAQ